MNPPGEIVPGLEEIAQRIVVLRGQHDEQLPAVIEALRQLTASPAPLHNRKMGFHRENR